VTFQHCGVEDRTHPAAAAAAEEEEEVVAVVQLAEECMHQHRPTPAEDRSSPKPPPKRF
jgi:hypothetical protein